MLNFHDAIKTYTPMGWSIIPLESHQKQPQKGFQWSKKSVSIKKIQNYSSVCNTGVALGERSNGLTDLDFDIAEAGIIAQKIFHQCPGFGRKSSPYGHKVLRCPDAGKTQQFQLTKEEGEAIGLKDDEKSVVMEVRANGAQTMIPPSTHPCGEELKWHDGVPKNIPEIEYQEVLKQAGLCSFLTVVLRMYPYISGSRDEICLALAGTLLRAELTPEYVDDLIVFIADQKDDDEAYKRAKARTSRERLDNGEDVTGLPTLCKLLDIESLENTLSKWLYGSSSKPKIDTDKRIAEMNENFFVVGNEGTKCRVAFFERRYFGRGQFRRVLVFQSFEDFRNRFMNQYVVTDFTDEGKPITKPLGKFWLEHPDRRQYDRIEFAPGRETADNIFNLWRGFAFEPKEGSWTLMEQHIKRILADGDEEANEYIIKWAAWSIQNPGEPAEVAIVFRGGKGTGKGTYGRALTSMFGDHGLHITSSKHLTGTFNAHLRDCVLLFADEAAAPHDKNVESVMKGLITEPSISIEGKGRDVVQERNQLHIIMASNDVWVVPASADERRFAVFDISDEMAGREDWFTPLNEEMENGGLEAMLHYFMNLELDDWHPRKNIPDNQALNNQRIASLKGPEMLWFDYLSTAEADGDKKDLGVAIPTKYFAQRAKITPKAAGEFLKKMGCTHDRNSRPTTWVTPPLDEARKVWDQKQFPASWNNETAWLSVSISPGDPPF